MNDNCLNERGTSLAIFEYAQVLKKAGHQVTVAFKADSPDNNQEVIDRFKTHFKLLPYINLEKLYRASDQFDLAYWIKSGENDDKLMPGIPNFIHVVFQAFEPHGEKYFYISDWLAKSLKHKYKDSKTAFESIRSGTKNANSFESVPHIVRGYKPTRNIRNDIGVPEESLLVTRYGGKDTFDLRKAQKAVKVLANRYNDVYFCFINTEPFINNSRVLFLPPIIDFQEKFNYLHSSDVFFHARKRGESFGLAIAEASSVGLPTISWRGGIDKNHLKIVDSKNLYSSKRNIVKLIEDFRTRKISGNLLKNEPNLEYSPEVVGPEFLKMLNL